MAQINIRIDEKYDKILDYLVDRKKVSKSTIVKEIFTENFLSLIIPILLEDYSSGRISLKKLIDFSGLPASKVFDLIAEHDIESPITKEIDDYTKAVADKLIATWKENNKTT